MIQHSTSSRVLNIAHRGARAFAPENTLEAIEKAAALGADMVELDVQLSADAQLVVLHDATLERCSDVRRRFPNRTDYSVRAFTLAEIQSLDAGTWFMEALAAEPSRRPLFLQSLTDGEIAQFISPVDRAHYRSGQVRHPTLEQALMRAGQLGMRMNVELKVSDLQEDHPILADRVVRLIEEFNLHERVLLSSFDHDSLRRVKALQPALAIAVLVDKPLADPVGYCRALQASAYHPECEKGDRPVLPQLLPQTGPVRSFAPAFEALRAAGIAVHVWTENDPDRMKCLIDAGVSGIFTDYPNRLAALLVANR